MEVLYEDNHVIIVNKTCSEIVQGDKTGDTPLSEMLKASKPHSGFTSEPKERVTAPFSTTQTPIWLMRSLRAFGVSVSKTI